MSSITLTKLFRLLISFRAKINRPDAVSQTGVGIKRLRRYYNNHCFLPYSIKPVSLPFNIQQSLNTAKRTGNNCTLIYLVCHFF